MLWPAVARPSTGLTPVSMTATSTPAPVYPAAHQARTPVYVVVLYMELTSVTGSYGPAAGADPGAAGAAPGHPSGRAPRQPARRAGEVEAPAERDGHLVTVRPAGGRD